MPSLSNQIASEIWPPLVVSLAGAIFALPAAAMIVFAIHAAG